MHFKFLKRTKEHNSKRYGPLAPILVYTIQPVIVLFIWTFSFLVFMVPEKSVMKVFKNDKIWNLWRDINSKMFGPLATILPLHLPYLRDQVWYKFYPSRTTNIKVIEQNFNFLKTYQGT